MSKLPIVRHMRYFYHKAKMFKHYDFWNAIGYYGEPSEFEYEYLNDIWAGKK